MKLSDKTCKNAKPKEKPYKLADGGGLYLEIMPSGSKCWRMKYRHLGKEKRLAFGVYPLTGLKNKAIFIEAEELLPEVRLKKIISEAVIGQSLKTIDGLRLQIVAPAGIGKTTAVCENLSRCRGMNVYFMLPTLELAIELQ